MNKVKQLIIIIFILSIYFIPFSINNTYNVYADEECTPERGCTKRSKSANQINNELWGDDDRCPADVCNDVTVLGSAECPCSVAYFVKMVFNYIRILGPLLVIGLTAIDFALAVIKSDEDHYSKIKKRLKIRIVLILLLFIAPSIIEIILTIFGIAKMNIDFNG